MTKKYDISLRDACERLARTIEQFENLKEQLSELEQDNCDPEAVELIRACVTALESRISNQKNRLESFERLAERYEAD